MKWRSPRNSFAAMLQAALSDIPWSSTAAREYGSKRGGMPAMSRCLSFGGRRELPATGHVVQDGNDDERQEARNEYPEQQRNGEPVEDGVVENEQGAEHRREAGQHDRLGAGDRGTDDGVLKVRAFAYLH